MSPGRITRAALLAAALALLAVAAAPAAAQGTDVAQSGTARGFGGQIQLTDQDVLPPSAEAGVTAPPFAEAQEEALIEVPAAPLAVSFTAQGKARLSETATLTSEIANAEAAQAVEGPYHAQAVGIVEDLQVLVDAVGEGVPLLRADLVRGEAVGVCTGGAARYSASSEIVNLVIGGQQLPLNAPLSQIVDAIGDVLEQTTLNQVVDVQRNVVTELADGGIAVDALVVTVLAAAGDTPLLTVRLGHAEVGPLACGQAAAPPDEPVQELPAQGPTGPGEPTLTRAAPVAAAELPRTGAGLPVAAAGLAALAGMGLAAVRRLAGGAA